MTMTSFYTESELKKIGFKSYGCDVLISRNANFYSPENISIGNYVRIDDFCILSAGGGYINIADYVHISAYCALYGSFGIDIKSYSGMSPRCIILSASDDFSGNFLIGPLVNKKLINVKGGKVILENYVQIGTASVILPSVTINEGSVVGAMSLVNKSLPEWGVYAGTPVKKLKDRSKGLLKLRNYE